MALRSEDVEERIALNSQTRAIERENGEDRNSQGSESYCSRTLRYVQRGVMFVIVLACVTLSKLTLVLLTDKLRMLTVGKKQMEPNQSWDGESGSKEVLYNYTLQGEVYDNHSIAQIYWLLLFILMLPHCLTFVRSALIGVIGKTRKAYPWPCKRALIVGAVCSVAEVGAMSVFVFSVLCYLPPDLAPLGMQAVFIFQFLLDFYYLWIRKLNGNTSGCYNANKSEYETIGEEGQHHKRYCSTVVENKLVKPVSVFLQFIGIIGFMAFLVVKASVTSEVYLFPVIGMPLSIAILSIVWSNNVQEYLANPQRKSQNLVRYKANFINSALRILLYPFVAYAVFYIIHHEKGIEINLWSVLEKDFKWSSDNLLLFLMQIVTSFFGYLFAWIACIMTLWRLGFALPLLLSTPLYIIIITLHSYLSPLSPNGQFLQNSSHMSFVALGFWFVIYIGLLLGIACFLCTKKNLILAQDKDMFINPHYDSVFLEQYLVLNRQVNKYPNTNLESPPDDKINSPRAIFICSTMFRETVREMSQMLKSIKRVSIWHASQQRSAGDRADMIESHIFFDAALNGSQLTHYPLQLLSLVNDCLGVNLSQCRRRVMPYGESMTWDVGESKMKFTVHLKDNFKVKNKKRWSQVMYMNYVINHRIQISQKEPDEKYRLQQENTFILTTDADIYFTADSAMVLLDSLASNSKVGAVCARTHPKGSGPMYWYQVFDYAIGHWFVKSAEHIFGCVLCCPGCFSVFRCSALNQVLREYSSEVKGAFDFLTKDMGEDRWLCTLLIQKGWRLEYCAISNNHTYCPESFDEFYKQRRRWVPSTMANILLLISKVKGITKTSNTVSMLFIILQAIVAFSTIISPASVIILIATGLQGAYHISYSGVLLTIITLTLLSVLYGLVCLFTSQKTQLDIAKVLTFVFAILMAVVAIGIVKEIIFEIFPVDETVARHNIINYPNCIVAKGNQGTAEANTSALSLAVCIPTSPSTWYIALFGITFFVAAILHLREWTCLVHSIWYLLALPSGYLLLLIYSAANLNSQSWGTREAIKPGEGFVMVKKLVYECVAFCCRRKVSEQKVSLLSEPSDSEEVDEEETTVYPDIQITHKKMAADAIRWLKEQELDDADISKFEAHGYWNLSYIASMEREDFKAIGILRQGFVLRLEKAAKKLPVMVIETEVPANIAEWLTTLQMDEYIDVFHSAGYKTEEDVENLKELSEKEMRKMGINKMAHIQRLRQALYCLLFPTEVESHIYKAKREMKQLEPDNVWDEETNFWTSILSKELKPVAVRLQKTNEIGQKLKSLRNSTLAIIFLINITWLILLYTLTFPHLVSYHLPEQAFQLLFLGTYGIIIFVSFVAMVLHRFVTLIHFLGKPQVTEKIDSHSEDIP